LEIGALPVTSDKSYATETRLNALINATGPINPGSGAGGNGQRRTYWMPGPPQTVNSTSQAPISGMTGVPVVSGGSYEFSGLVCGQQGPAAVAQSIRFDGPTISFGRVFTETNAQANTSVTDSDLTGALPWIHTTPAWGSGIIFYIRFHGFFTASSGTNFGVFATSNSGTNTWLVAAASLLTIESVGQTL
jgi:hypothetical protein